MKRESHAGEQQQGPIPPSERDQLAHRPGYNQGCQEKCRPADAKRRNGQGGRSRQPDEDRCAGNGQNSHGEEDEETQRPWSIQQVPLPWRLR